MSQLPFDWTPSNADDQGAATPPPSPGPAPSGPPTPWTVSRLGTCILDALSVGVPDPVDVVGEVANWTLRNGHWYFSLRDDSATVQCVMWASDVAGTDMTPESGDRVVVRGSVTHWARQGRTQLRVRRIKRDGVGDLQAAYRRLCDEFRSAGWFDDAAKKPLPRVPERIAVLTSGVSAALQDVLRTAGDRWPACQLMLVDVPVQGAAAASRIAQAIASVDAAAPELGIEAMLVTRGGGSIEDLWAFNERVVAEAVHAAVTPIVAAIGHESDTTIIELIADVRASTPTRAMDLLLPSRTDELARLDLLADGLGRRMRHHLTLRRQHVATAEAALIEALGRRLSISRRRVDAASEAMTRRQPHARLASRRKGVEAATARLRQAMVVRLHGGVSRLQQADLRSVTRGMLERREAQVEQLQGVLSAVGPESVLDRGYSITVDVDGRVVRSVSDVAAGDPLTTKLADGSIDSLVRSIDAAEPSR